MSRRLPVLGLVFVLGLGPWAERTFAQTATAPPPARTTSQPPQGQASAVQPPAEPDETTNLSRIKEGLARPQVIRLEQDRLRFYMKIVGKGIDVHEYLRNSDLKHAPVPRSGVTHQDFINHITPKYLYSSGGINATDLLQWGLVNWFGQMAIKKAVTEIGDYWREAQIRRIREQIDRELAALRGGK